MHNILYTTSFETMAGGGQWSLYYLIKHLDKRRFHPIVLCPGEGELAERMREIGAEVLFLKMGRIRHLNPLVVWRLLSFIKENSIDLIHTDSTTETFYCGIAAGIRGIPLVWHIRVDEGGGFLYRVLSMLATRIIIVSQALRMGFPWLRSDDRLAIIYNAIDLEDFDSSSTSPIRKELEIKGGETLLASIGRIEEKKGHEILISAMKDIKDARLVIIGRGEAGYINRLKALSESYGISDRVFFMGYREDIPSILKEIDILVVTSFTEGFSRAILEAMAAGKPVIATDVGGNREAVADGLTGYIVPPGDSNALVNRIKDLINAPEKRERMGRAGRKRVEEEFTIEKNIEKVEGIYRELLHIQDQDI